MSLRYDDVIPKLLGLGTSNSVLADAKEVAVVRDQRGIVRLALDAEGATRESRNELEAALESVVGSWYSGPALYADAGHPQGRLAREILNRARGHWPVSWPRAVSDLVRGSETAVDTDRWGAIQRLLSKQTWLADQKISSPWPLHKKTPTIVSFYSYKGGVGRSTLVAIIAALLAREGDNVAILDLDLEAPGQQTLFDATPTRGVIDYVVEHLALGNAQLEGLMTDVSDQIAGAKGRVHLASSGKLGWPYVEKIARLDFHGHTREGDSPVHLALKSLLADVRASVQPDWILLDARTGIHDLGGLAMHALAHIDVLVAREGRQGREGLELCLEALARRRDPKDILTLIVHAFAPAPLDDDEVSKPVQAKYRQAVYELYERTLYEVVEDLEMPALADRVAPHAPYPIPLDPTLGRLEFLRDMFEQTMGRPHYDAIVRRLRELAAVEEGE